MKQIRKAMVEEEIPTLLERMEQRRLTGMTTSDNSWLNGRGKAAKDKVSAIGSVDSRRPVKVARKITQPGERNFESQLVLNETILPKNPENVTETTTLPALGATT